MNVVKKDVHDKLVAKVNNIDISGFVSKTKNDTKIRFRKKKLVMQTKKYLKQKNTTKLVHKTD